MAESVISNTIKTKEVTATTDAGGRVQATSIGISLNRIVNAICISPSYGYMKIANYNGSPYLWYFKDASTENALANQTVKAKVYYI